MYSRNLKNALLDILDNPKLDDKAKEQALTEIFIAADKIQKSYKQQYKKLRSKGISINKQPKMHLVNARRVSEKTSRLLNPNKDEIDFKGELRSAANGEYESALMIAANNGDALCVKKLIEYKADPHLYIEVLNIPKIYDYTTPMWARVEEPKDPNYMNAFSLALEKGHTACVKALLAAGSNPNFIYHRKLRPLHQAIRFGHTDCAIAIMEAKADLNQLDPFDNEDELFIATYKNNIQVIESLLKHGAAPTNHKGKLNGHAYPFPSLLSEKYVGKMDDPAKAVERMLDNLFKWEKNDYDLNEFYRSIKNISSETSLDRFLFVMHCATSFIERLEEAKQINPSFDKFRYEKEIYELLKTLRLKSGPLREKFYKTIDEDTSLPRDVVNIISHFIGFSAPAENKKRAYGTIGSVTNGGFFTDQATSLSNELGFVRTSEKDMKQIDTDFFRTWDKEALRNKQGLKLIEICSATDDVLDKIKKSVVPNEDAITLLFDVKRKIAEGMEVLSLDPSDLSNSVISAWFSKLTYFTSTINKALLLVNKKLPEENNTTSCQDSSMKRRK